MEQCKKADLQNPRILQRRGVWYSPLARFKNNQRSLSCKTKQNKKKTNAINGIENQEEIKPLSCHQQCIYPVSLRFKNMNGQTPTILATTSTSESILSLFVMLLQRRLDRNVIQSRCSLPSKLVTVNSVTENRSMLLSTDDATFWRHHANKH